MMGPDVRRLLALAMLLAVARGLSCNLSSASARNLTAVATNSYGPSAPSSSVVVQASQTIVASVGGVWNQASAGLSGDGSTLFYAEVVEAYVMATLSAYALVNGAWTLQAQEAFMDTYGFVSALNANWDGTRVALTGADRAVFFDYDGVASSFSNKYVTDQILDNANGNDQSEVRFSSDGNKIVISSAGWYGHQVFRRSGASWTWTFGIYYGGLAHAYFSGSSDLGIAVFAGHMFEKYAVVGTFQADDSFWEQDVHFYPFANGEGMGDAFMTPNGTRYAIVNGIRQLFGGVTLPSSVALYYQSFQSGSWSLLASRTDSDYGSLGRITGDPNARRFYVLAARNSDGLVCVLSYQYVEVAGTGSFVRDRIFEVSGQYASTNMNKYGKIFVSPSDWSRPFVLVTKGQEGTATAGKLVYL